jgi:hypothetical protein
MARRSAQPETLTKALARLLTGTLLPDLRARTAEPAVQKALQERYEAERKERKTGATFIDWREQVLDQVGAAWALSCVFVRTLEDRGLVEQHRIAGAGAADSLQLFYELAPHLGPREYLLTVFREISRLPGAGDLLGPKHNAAWRLGLSQDAARALLEFFDERDEGRELRWTFDGEETRFLGDLYQDLSEAVRERYALLQTPDFVEEFILDRTLEPAIEEFGLEAVKVIDPTCGSGHFLLGAFSRLFEYRLRARPAADPKVVALEALAQVHGVDVNPYAVAIARFRLTLMYLRLAGLRRLREAPRGLECNVVVADSLRIEGGRGVAIHAGELFADEAWGQTEAIFELEDPEGARRVLRGRYQVVVGNPPYITVKDPELREVYRSQYRASAVGKYALSAPFADRFFQLAAEGGFVGQITSNSFMKREFGKGLIEQVFPHLDLTEIIDTSGAYIPGHGTPTVILVGRNRPPASPTVFAVQGKRGEPSTPAEPAKGDVWLSILKATEAGVGKFENEFVSTARIERVVLNLHPWSLGGGGASELKARLDGSAPERLGELASIGIGSIPGVDDVFVHEAHIWARTKVEPGHMRPFVTGDLIRNWHAPAEEVAFHPYQPTGLITPQAQTLRLFWPARSVMYARATFGGGTYRSEGRPWFEWHQVTLSRYATPLSITFPEVATHNHFVLDRGGRVFKQTAPVIKLPSGASEEDHFVLLGLLNSSTACFWMKQVFFIKGGDSTGTQMQSESWSRRMQADSTKLSTFPLPTTSDVVCRWLASELTRLGEARQCCLPKRTISEAFRCGASADELYYALATGREQHARLTALMVGMQEALDWRAYALYGLFTIEQQNQLNADLPDGQPLAPGHRPFEILLARQVAAGSQPDYWFSTHKVPPVTAVPATYPQKQQELINARIRAIESMATIRLIEQREYKRRWMPVDWEAEEQAALRTWLLDRLEAESKPTPRQPASIRELADTLQHDAAVQAVVSLLAKNQDADLVTVLADLAQTDAVPYLAAQRYTDSGLEKRAAWESTWALQRREDAGEVLPVPVPPKYGSGDFKSATYWSLRGKLDVPKERFILYPGANRDDDTTPLLLWAGADHLDRALALASLYHDRHAVEAWPSDRLLPLLAGLLELVPWLQQWHNDPDPARGGQRMGDYFARFVEEEARRHGKTLDDLRTWRPEAAVRRRARKPVTA